MKLLAPLGLLGLIGVIILIIIYVIRPNYQQKYISSTYVWRLSLRYKKKRIPVSNLRNIILIICQVLILSLCAFLLARPNGVLKEQTDEREVIAIIDSSASMRTKKDEYTRFERAVDKVLSLSGEVFSQNGIVSVMIANAKPYYLVERETRENETAVTDKVDALVSSDTCSYGSADMDGAISLCDQILVENPDAKIYLFTDSSYAYVPSSVTVENVSDEEEWNAAILNAYAEIEENYYTFYVEVACYGKSAEVEIEIEVSGANASDKNDEGSVYSYKSLISCPQGITQRAVFRNMNSENDSPAAENEVVIPIDALFSYQRVSVILNEEDNFTDDNVFFVYGGQKEPIRIQYASADPNSLIPASFYIVRRALSATREVVIDEVKKGEEPKTEGYDLYVYEHRMPDALPKDGAVLMLDPLNVPAGSGLSFSEECDFRGQLVPLTEENSHPTLKGVTASALTVSRYVKITSHDPGYEELLSVNGDPVFLVKDEGAVKIAVLAYSVHYSNFGITPECFVLLRNIVEYFMPSIVKGNAFEVDEEITVNTRGENMFISGAVEEVIDVFPATLVFDLPGTYDLSQTTYFSKPISESIYVRIPVAESNIRATFDALKEPFRADGTKDFYADWVMYFALALVALEFLEWFLQSREGI